MSTINIDHRKVRSMSMAALHEFNDSGAHPAEVILALAEAIGRVVVSLDAAGVSDIAKKELVDLAIKHMAQSIEAGMPKVIT